MTDQQKVNEAIAQIIEAAGWAAMAEQYRTDDGYRGRILEIMPGYIRRDPKTAPFADRLDAVIAKARTAGLIL